MVYPSIRLCRLSGQAVEPTPLSQLLHFFVPGVLAARIAKLLRFHPVGMLLPIFGGRVIPIFAIVALQRNDFAHSFSLRLLDNLRDGACADRMAAFADREAQPLLQRYRRDQTDFRRYVVSRHHHFYSRRQLYISGYVRGPEIKLRPVSREEWRVPPAFFLRQYVRFRLELRVRRDRSWLAQHLPAFYFFLLRAAQQQSHVIARHAFVQQLAEHFDSRHYSLHRRTESYNLYFFPYLHLAALHPPGYHRAASRN